MKKLIEWLRKSEEVVVFTGAGISTESGLKDFRGENGIYKNIDPFKILSSTSLNTNKSMFTKFCKEWQTEIISHSPNKSHCILAEWEHRGVINTIITQNIDGYHQKAGNKKVIELHGNIHNCYCMKCGKRHTSDKLGDVCFHNDFTFAKEEGQFSGFDTCDGYIRPDIVLFDEKIKNFKSAFLKVIESDLFIVLGSSLRVLPANTLPRAAKSTGSKVVIINKEPTPLDYTADLVINNQLIGEVLEKIDKSLYGSL